jgi:actin-related protein
MNNEPVFMEYENKKKSKIKIVNNKNPIIITTGSDNFKLGIGSIDKFPMVIKNLIGNSKKKSSLFTSSTDESSYIGEEVYEHQNINIKNEIIEYGLIIDWTGMEILYFIIFKHSFEYFFYSLLNIDSKQPV